MNFPRIPDPKPIADHLAVYAAGGGLVVLAIYGTTLPGVNSPESLSAFVFLMSLMVLVTAGLTLWVWNALHGAQAIFRHLRESKEGSEGARRAKAWMGVAGYLLLSGLFGFLVFILTGLQVGVVS